MNVSCCTIVVFRLLLSFPITAPRPAAGETKMVVLTPAGLGSAEAFGAAGGSSEGGGKVSGANPSSKQQWLYSLPQVEATLKLF